MANVRHLLTAFFAGEITPFLSGRVESDAYRFGLSTCENFLPTIEGPLVKRPGFQYVNAAEATTSWMNAFRFSVSQEYVIELGEEQARFYTNGGRIETGPGVAYEIVTPYTALEAPYLSTQQSFDRLYVDHTAHPPGAIKRTSAVTFAHEQLALIDGPFADQNIDTSITVTVNAVTGGITITASGAIFLAGHVGAPFRIEATDFSDIKAWEPGMKLVAIGDKVRNDGKAYIAATAGTSGNIQPTHSSGSEWDGLLKNDLLNDKGPYGVKWTYVHDRFGIATITAVGGGGTTATATVTRRFPDSLTSVASHRWAHGAFSEAAGWPGLVSIAFGRHIHIKDYDIVGSVVGDYGGGTVNFATHSDSGVLADDLAFRRRISLEGPALWMVRDKKRLLLGTSTREVAIGPTNTADAFSGRNISADDQSYYGSEPIFPVQAGTETFFIEAGGRRIRSADYDFARDRYDAPDLTSAAGHITRGGILQLATQRVPYQLVIGVRGDGQFVVHPRSRVDVKGLARYVLGGGAAVKSAVSIKGEDGKTCELWALIERPNADNDTVREIWRQAPWRDLGDHQDEQFYVDGGIRIEAIAGQTHFSGLDWLAGQDVAVLAAGGVVPGLSVAVDGTLDLPATAVPSGRAFTVMVGLAYTALAVTLPPNAEVNGRSSQGVRQRVLKVLTRVLETVGIKVGTPGFDPVPVIDRAGDDQMDAPIPLKTGDYGGEVEAEHDKEGRATWQSDDPTAAIVTMAAIKAEVDFADV